MDKVRGFEIIDEDLLPKRKDGSVVKPHLPVRATLNSAGYDIMAISEGVIMPGQSVKVSTGIKAYMMPDEVLKIYSRSSMGIKYGVTLANGTAIIDSDYYGNPTNDGEIIICLRNNGRKAFRVNYGDRIAQGIFCKYLSVDVGTALEANKVREGGIGSTGK